MAHGEALEAAGECQADSLVATLEARSLRDS